jgi:hypothetical protein
VNAGAGRVEEIAPSEDGFFCGKKQKSYHAPSAITKKPRHNNTPKQAIWTLCKSSIKKQTLSDLLILRVQWSWVSQRITNEADFITSAEIIELDRIDRGQRKAGEIRDQASWSPSSALDPPPAPERRHVAPRSRCFIGLSIGSVAR